MKHNSVHGWWFIVHSIFILFALSAIHYPLSTVFAQQGDDLEFTLDVSSETIPLPKIFKPGIDLSGRGFNRDVFWPQNLAVKDSLDKWKKEIGFGGLYRLQYNLWEIEALARSGILQDKLLENYEGIIKEISASGGTVVLDIFGTPAGMGKVLDKKSAPADFQALKELIKRHIRRLSCDKGYNIWYEVWSAPDLDEFFLGSQQEYLNLYRAVSEAAIELSAETKIYIPVGGPGVSWWFHSLEGNTPATPEKSLIYNLIKFCYRYHLPLDFISWHAYSTDPRAEKETCSYNKYPAALIRDWLSFLDFDRNTLLVVSEWNYDSGANVLASRQERSYIAASYIVSRINNMYEAGLDYQTYFCLEDFKNNKEGVVRNTGVFTFDSGVSEYKGVFKTGYNAFQMLSQLGNGLFAQAPKTNDEFIGIIPTRNKDGDIALLIYNYIDPEISRSYLADNISALNNAEKKSLVVILKSNKWDKIIQQKLDTRRLGLTHKVRALLRKAQELYIKADKFSSLARSINLNLKNLKGNYSYQRYTISPSCALNCPFTPVEEKEITPDGLLYKETLALPAYSVNLIILKNKPPAAAAENSPAAPAVQIGQTNDTSVEH